MSYINKRGIQLTIQGGKLKPRKRSPTNLFLTINLRRAVFQEGPDKHFQYFCILTFKSVL